MKRFCTAIAYVLVAGPLAGVFLKWVFWRIVLGPQAIRPWREYCAQADREEKGQ